MCFLFIFEVLLLCFECNFDLFWFLICDIIVFICFGCMMGVIGVIWDFLDVVDCIGIMLLICGNGVCGIILLNWVVILGWKLSFVSVVGLGFFIGVVILFVLGSFVGIIIDCVGGRIIFGDIFKVFWFNVVIDGLEVKGSGCDVMDVKLGLGFNICCSLSVLCWGFLKGLVFNFFEFFWILKGILWICILLDILLLFLLILFVFLIRILLFFFGVLLIWFFIEFFYYCLLFL